MAVKHTMIEPIRPEIAAATARENAHFAELMGAQANAAALADFNKAPLSPRREWLERRSQWL